MTAYFWLFIGGDAPPTEDERVRAMDEWAGWFEDVGDAVKDRGLPFTGPASHVMRDGTFTDDYDAATGYLIVEARWRFVPGVH